MRNRFLPFLLIMLSIVTGGCGGSEITIPTPIPTASPTEDPRDPFFTPTSGEPVFFHGAEGEWYAGAVEPGAVLFHEGRFHLFFNGFDGWPSRSAVGYAVSSDGISWVPAAVDPLLNSADAEFPGFTFFVSSVLQLDGGSWAMYLYTLDEGRDGAPGSILLALADHPAGPWSLEADPILLPGEPGAWDGSRVTQPHVIRVAEGYRMYFAGYENDRLRGGRRIGTANSVDGISWVKNPAPVFEFSEDARDWDAFRVFQPRVVAIPEGYLMLYKSNVSVGRSEAWGLAFSADGLSWTRYAENPIITDKTYVTDWRRNGIADLVIADGELVLYLEILEREGGAYHHGNAGYRSNIFRFTSDRLP